MILVNSWQWWKIQVNIYEIIDQTSRDAWKRNVESHLFLTVGLILSWVSSETEIQLLLTTSKNQQLLTLNLRGEKNHEKGLPEDADVTASQGFYTLWRLLYFWTLDDKSTTTWIYYIYFTNIKNIGDL